MKKLIIEKEKFRDEQQLIKDKKKPENCFIVNQDFIHKGIPAIISELLIITAMFKIGVWRINMVYNEKINTDMWFALKFIIASFVAFVIYPYIHEFFHFVIYPNNSTVHLWKYYDRRRYFVYCDTEISKSRLVVLLLMPFILTALLFYIIWFMYASTFGVEWCCIMFIFIIYNTLMCFLDLGAVFMILFFVPNNVKLRFYGFDLYYYKDQNKN